VTGDPRPPVLYAVQAGARRSACRECGAAMAFVPGKKAGSYVPLSLDSPFAERDEQGKVVAAASHYTDCPNPKRFSKRTPA